MSNQFLNAKDIDLAKIFRILIANKWKLIAILLFALIAGFKYSLNNPIKYKFSINISENQRTINQFGDLNHLMSLYKKDFEVSYLSVMKILENTVNFRNRDLLVTLENHMILDKDMPKEMEISEEFFKSLQIKNERNSLTYHLTFEDSNVDGGMKKIKSLYEFLISDVNKIVQKKIDKRVKEITTKIKRSVETYNVDLEISKQNKADYIDGYIKYLDSQIPISEKTGLDINNMKKSSIESTFDDVLPEIYPSLISSIQSTQIEINKLNRYRNSLLASRNEVENYQVSNLLLLNTYKPKISSIGKSKSTIMILSSFFGFILGSLLILLWNFMKKKSD